MRNEPAAPDRRNIIDHYKYWNTEAVKADLDTKRFPFSVLLCNWQNDFNVGGAIRNANAFMASMVYLWGRKKYDKRGCVGTHRYTNIRHFKRIEDIDEICNNHSVVVFELTKDSVPLNTFEWPNNPLMVFGQESIGVEQEVLDRADHIVYVPQYGSVRSLNVACASAVAMYDWCSKNEHNQRRL